MELQVGRGYMGSGEGHEVQVSTFIFCSWDSCGRYVFLNTSLFSEFVKGKINIFASLFSNFVKRMFDNANDSVCGYPYLVRHSGMNVPSGGD